MGSGNYTTIPIINLSLYLAKPFAPVDKSRKDTGDGVVVVSSPVLSLLVRVLFIGFLGMSLGRAVNG